MSDVLVCVDKYLDNKSTLSRWGVGLLQSQAGNRIGGGGVGVECSCGQAKARRESLFSAISTPPPHAHTCFLARIHPFFILFVHKLSAYAIFSRRPSLLLFFSQVLSFLHALSDLHSYLSANATFQLAILRKLPSELSLTKLPFINCISR